MAVPLPLSTKPTPTGRSPGSLMVGVGVPVVVTVNVPDVPTVNVAEVLPLPNDGAVPEPGFTVSVKLWVALGVTPLSAVIVMG